MPPSSAFTPLYVQIRDFIRNGIESGEFAPGERLPSEKELSSRFKTTRATVARALQELVFEGLVQRRAGSGTFVLQPDLTIPFETTRIRSFDEQVAASGERISYRLLGFGVTDDSRAAAALGEPKGSIYLLERVRLANAVPLSLERRFIPADIGDQLTVSALNTLSIHRILEEVIKQPVAAIEGVIRVGSAGATLSELLNVQQGAPLLIRDYTLCNAEGRALVFGESFYKEQFRIPYQVRQNE
ncbi:GntR family transcriptional regulator [Amorphus sp. 3PC139-8]|uniref:GntR family transcriptional regulator n=1 Tax=Amorphus sp. 3PC139-8 TaxID=2735676 RepID=UPI00345CBD18